MAHKIILFGHILCGFLALTLGIIPMVTKKGGKTHKFWGRIYAWSMYGVSLGAFLLFLLNPSKIFLQFLLAVAALSFYLTFTGMRSIGMKNSGTGPRPYDWLICIGVGLMGLFSIGMGIFHALGNPNNHSMTIPILFIGFGFFIVSNALADVKRFTSPANPPKMAWFFNHFTRMLGAYIATFTAFCVVNNHYFPELIAWFGPGLVGGIGIAMTVKYYKTKFKSLTHATVEFGKQNS